MTSRQAARFLMCRPDHFAVTYAINPWMDPQSWARRWHAHAAASRQEWEELYRKLRALGAEIELVPPAPEVPDLVFTANAAVVLDGKALLSRFRYGERRREEAHFEAAFAALHRRGLVDRVRPLPDGVVIEGAGDCVFDATRNLFWMGYGPRSDLAARGTVRETFGVEVVALELADPRFYHADTALCPLPRGELLYVPGAFTAEGRAAIRDRVAPAARIEVGIEDAGQLAANAVSLGDHVVMSACSERLRGELLERGYQVATTSLDAFLRSGGAAFCLTLRLDRRSAARATAAPDVGAPALIGADAVPGR